VEYTPDIIKLVPNTPEAFAAAYRALIEDRQARETLGRNAQRVAEERWSPRKAESRFVEIYQQALVEAHGGSITDWQPDYRSLAEITSGTDSQ
jgi:glycosyltransferase involved in cell wall biosynthesis